MSTEPEERMRTHPRRSVTVTGAVVALATAIMVVPLAPASAQSGADPAPPRRSALELAQERLDEARRLATDAAERLSAAETRRNELGVEIAAAEEEIPRLRARAEELRRMIRERAARLYVRSATPQLDLVVNTTNIVDAQRAAHLTATIGDHEEAVAVELHETAHALEVRQAQLREQRAELERSIAAIIPLREALEAKLEIASNAYDKVRTALATRASGTDVVTGAGLCPVQGFAVVTGDFGEQREDGVHQGVDLAAKEGTPAVAVVDGFMARDISDAGGNGAWVRGGDDVSYYYAHFTRYEGDATERWVKAGDVIGFVGSTGRSTGPHLHFEVHPNHGPAVDGLPLLLTLCADEMLPLAKQSTK